MIFDFHQCRIKESMESEEKTAVAAANALVEAYNKSIAAFRAVV